MVKSTGITLSQEIDNEFRECISLAYPTKRGNRKRAAEEAIKEWCVKIRARGDKKC
jgi:hypothetical protein